MPITWRPANLSDLEASLEIQPKYLGDALVGRQAALDAWGQLLGQRASTMTVVEANPSIGAHRIIGFGASVFVSPSFADAELAHPRPDVNSRVIARIQRHEPVLASRSEIAWANAENGNDITILCGVWREEILSPAERQEVKILLATSFTELHAGYRLRRILCETVDELGTEFVERSVVYQPVARFRQCERSLYWMTRDSAKAVPGSLGNVLFSYREPVLQLRDSEQEILVAALRGATDRELATELNVTFAALKARWRSTFERIAKVIPDLVGPAGEHDSRGSQKRHRVLAYVRSHPEELRPYDWKRKPGNSSADAVAPAVAQTETPARREGERHSAL
jgi:hypothetical protein